MNLESIINQSYDRLTANDREVLNLVLRDKDLAGGMNSTQLASYCHVSRTTLVRLFGKLGIATFAEFKLLLGRQSSGPALSSLDMKEILGNYHRMIDDLREHDYREICGALHEADTIYLYGTGNEQKAIAEEFKRIFLMLGKCCMDLFDYGEAESASARFKPTDVFVVISLSGESEEGIRLLRYLQCRAIRTMSITKWDNNTMARMCRYSLYAGTRMIGSGGRQGYEMVAAFYILLDILSVSYLSYLQAGVWEEAGEGHEAGGTAEPELS